MVPTRHTDEEVRTSDELMTLAEIASFVRRSRSWVYQNLQWIPHYSLPGMRGHWFDRKEVLRWIKSGGADEGNSLASRDAALADLATDRSTLYHRKARPR